MNEHAILRTKLDNATLLNRASDRPGISEAQITCYTGLPPAFVDGELRTLYSNIHSTLAHLQVYGGFEDVTHTYVAKRHDQPIAIFLLQVKGDTVRVINEGMAIDEAELKRFAEYVFSTWRSVGAIRFHAVQMAEMHTPFRTIHCNACTADIVMPLPESVDDYVASLGRNMRRNLRRYMDRLKAAHPSFRYEFFEKGDVTDQHIRDIIALNRARITGKNLRYALDDEIEKLAALVRECGMAGVMTIDGRVVAGGVGYFAGNTFYFKVNAHDPAYNEFSAGILSCYLTISECIARGCKEFNFMWNEYEYKFALGGQLRNLHQVAIYRTKLHAFLKPQLAVGQFLDACRYRLASLSDKAAKPETLAPAERRIIQALQVLRATKRGFTGLLQRADA